jgi:hypothetical protein
LVSKIFGQNKLNRIIVIVGIAIVAIAKAIMLKFVIIDQPSYERCLSSMSTMPSPTLACGADPFIYFIIGWVIVAAGAVILIFGLKVEDKKTKISR